MFKTKILYKQWLWLVIGWILITEFFSWAILTNIELFVEIAGATKLVEENLLVEYMFSGWQYLESGLFGIFFGSAFFFISTLTDKQYLRRLSFGKIILIRSFLYLISLVITFFLIVVIFSLFGLIPDNRTMAEYFALMSTEYWILICFYFVICIVLTNIFLLVLRKFGPGNFIRLITGKYHKPREENKIFLFIDLKSSTTIAESLGHRKYSQLIRDCFHDLTDIVLRYKAEVYQYVGDEVVLCWDVKLGLSHLNCIKTLIAYRELIEKRSEYYQSRYGIIPDFKGGLDVGLVTVTEIGDIKRDIAYHGDVLNTASRIQEQCNKQDKKLLFSEHLHKLVDNFDTLDVELIGELSLRGKNEQLKIYGLN